MAGLNVLSFMYPSNVEEFTEGTGVSVLGEGSDVVTWGAGAAAEIAISRLAHMGNIMIFFAGCYGCELGRKSLSHSTLEVPIYASAVRLGSCPARSIHLPHADRTWYGRE